MFCNYFVSPPPYQKCPCLPNDNLGYALGCQTDKRIKKDIGSFGKHVLTASRKYAKLRGFSAKFDYCTRGFRITNKLYHFLYLVNQQLYKINITFKILKNHK